MKLHTKNFETYFTLLEIIVVIAIIMLIVGLSFAYVGRMPAKLVLASATTKVEQLLMSAQFQSSLRGVQRDVVFDSYSKTLLITDPVENLGDLQFPDKISDTPQQSQLTDKSSSYTISENITVEFPTIADNTPVYSFFPDGSASGPEMLLILKGHTISIMVSQLTGIVTTMEIEDN